MILNSRFVILFTLFLTLTVNGSTFNIQTITLEEQPTLNQERVSSVNLFEGALTILEDMATISLDLPTYSDNTSLVYFGKVGLAGIGLNLLQAREKDASWVGMDVNDRLLTLASSIGDHLIDIALYDNATHAVWTVHNMTSEIDISLEFGLLGLAEFFVELYNQTENVMYANYAEKTLQSVFDLVDKNSTDISFAFNTILPYENSWYSTSIFDSYFDLYATMTGLAYGTAGVASVAMKYLRDVDVTNTSLGNELLNKSLNWLWRQRIENGTELSFKTGVEMIGVGTTGIAVGTPGIGDMYLELHEFTGNNSYLNNAIGVKDWLNGTSSLTRKTDITWYINDTVIFDKELGVHMGIAGNLIFLDHLNDLITNDNLTDMIVSAGSNMRNYGRETDNKMEFGERVLGNNIRVYGSTSMSFGGGGIFKIINDLGTKYDIGSLLEFGSKAKNYVTSMYQNLDGNYAIYDVSTFSMETNPMRGLSGSLLFLSSFTEGIFEMSSNSLNFGSLEIGESLDKTISLKNAGEGGLAVSWTSLSGSFGTIGQNITLDGLEEYLLNVTFTPTTESIVDDELIISVGNDLHNIGLNGIGFDTPTYTYEAPDNGSLLTDAKIYSFAITASDTSGMDDVTMTIRNENETSISSTQLPIVGETYVGSWDTKGYNNGTYIIDFEIVDILGHSSSLRLVYEIGFYTSRVEEVIFSEQTLYGIIGGIAVFLVVAVVITMRIKSKA